MDQLRAQRQISRTDLVIEPVLGQMLDSAPYIPDLNHHIGCQHTLDIEVPIHQQRQLMVAIESPDVLAWKGLTAASDQDARRKGIGP